ncbi:hypothetical protein HOF65_07050 [bacterium]|nr:hypothetical protein [bacterium]MBT3853675.1 hypothetical protein [bacterium]MBT4633039.1 hypothetical protein [bacterium]MBT5491976.1 hypothetical protein [bacterium]MBT6778381.1 hypothetical protein [bacterium]
MFQKNHPFNLSAKILVKLSQVKSEFTSLLISNHFRSEYDTFPLHK